jgi:hypothetical protein
MPDISMCNSSQCNYTKTCHRHMDSGTIPTPKRQSWFQNTGVNDDCDMYWPVPKNNKGDANAS